MLTLFSFAAILVAVVSVHEYGHYLAARFFGVRVLRFSVGFGKPFFCRKDKRGTEWALAPIPLGGYVRMLDLETARRTKLPEAECLEKAGGWRRIVIYAAGPLANFVFAAFLFWVLLGGGATGFRPVIDEVAANSPAARAGLRAGQEVAAVGGAPTRLWSEAQTALMDQFWSGEPLLVRLADGSEYAMDASEIATQDLAVNVAEELGLFGYGGHIKPKVAMAVAGEPAARAGMRAGDNIVAIGGEVIRNWRHARQLILARPRQPTEVIVWREKTGGITLLLTLAATQTAGGERGRLGVVPVVESPTSSALWTTVYYTAGERVGKAAARVWNDSSKMVFGIGRILSGRASTKNLSGPVGIAKMSGRAAEFGVVAWVYFLAIISLSLGVFNLLPLPVLDGGQIVLNVVQLAIGRDLPEKFLRNWNAVGICLLLLLFVFVLVKDISLL